MSVMGSRNPSISYKQLVRTDSSEQVPLGEAEEDININISRPRTTWETYVSKNKHEL